MSERIFQSWMIRHNRRQAWLALAMLDLRGVRTYRQRNRDISQNRKQRVDG